MESAGIETSFMFTSNEDAELLDLQFRLDVTTRTCCWTGLDLDRSYHTQILTYRTDVIFCSVSPLYARFLFSYLHSLWLVLEWDSWSIDLVPCCSVHDLCLDLGGEYSLLIGVDENCFTPLFTMHSGTICLYTYLYFACGASALMCYVIVGHALTYDLLVSICWLLLMIMLTYLKLWSTHWGGTIYLVDYIKR